MGAIHLGTASLARGRRRVRDAGHDFAVAREGKLGESFVEFPVVPPQAIFLAASAANVRGAKLVGAWTGERLWIFGEEALAVLVKDGEPQVALG